MNYKDLNIFAVDTFFKNSLIIRKELSRSQKTLLIPLCMSLPKLKKYGYEKENNSRLRPQLENS